MHSHFRHPGLVVICNGIAMDNGAGKTEGQIHCGGKTLKVN